MIASIGLLSLLVIRKTNMNYTQKPLIKLMKHGKMPGEAGIPKHIETVISNVFLFDTMVYKVYKNDNAFFNMNFRDIENKNTRFAFTHKDFAWNNVLSPSIYLELRGVRVVEGKIEFVAPTDDAEELLIVMKRVNTHEVLFERLMHNEISIKDAFAIGKQFAQQIKKVRTEKPIGNYFKMFANDIDDVRSWIDDVPEHKDEMLKWCNFLEEFRTKNRSWYEGALSDELAFSGDIHSHNALYTNGEFFLMDTYAPKDSWRIAHELLPFYRLGADMFALGSMELFESYLKGYEEGSGTKIDRRLDAPHILYGATIMVSYLYMLKKSDATKSGVASQYHDFTKDFYQKITRT